MENELTGDNEDQSVGGAGIFKTPKSLSNNAPNSALVVVGKLGDRCTRMLIDTGSAVSLVREDVWKEATELPVDLLTPPVRPIVAANGGELDLLGQDELQLQVGDLQVQFPVLIARDLTQECLLGADFLKQHDCVINERTNFGGWRKTGCVPTQSIP